MSTPLKLENLEYSLQILRNTIIKFTGRKFKDSGTKPENKFKDASQYQNKKVEIHRIYSSRMSSRLHYIPLPEMF